jgi:hypothetical protein
MLTVGAIINQIAQVGIAIRMSRLHKLKQNEIDSLEKGVVDGTIKELNETFALIRLFASYGSVLTLGILFFLEFNLIISILACIMLFILVSIFHIRSIDEKMAILREVVKTGNENLFIKNFSVKPLLFGLFVFVTILIVEIGIFIQFA